MITATQLDTFRARKAAGEKVSTLAAELGIPWQKLDKAIRHNRPVLEMKPTAPRPAARKAPAELAPAPKFRPGSLTKRHRPKALSEIFGQPAAVTRLRGVIADQESAAVLMEGETGTGKTSAALALAADLGCAMDQDELGGVWTIASGEQSADAVRDTIRQMWNIPFYGSGWKVVIVNECDRMAKPAETIWLDRLENLPPRTVVVFTTNFGSSLSPRFRDRCIRIRFESDPARTTGAAVEMLRHVWEAETGQPADPETLVALVDSAVEGGHLSFRRVLQRLEDHVSRGK